MAHFASNHLLHHLYCRFSILIEFRCPRPDRILIYFTHRPSTHPVGAQAREGSQNKLRNQSRFLCEMHLKLNKRSPKLYQFDPLLMVCNLEEIVANAFLTVWSLQDVVVKPFAQSYKEIIVVWKFRYVVVKPLLVWKVQVVVVNPCAQCCTDFLLEMAR